MTGEEIKRVEEGCAKAGKQLLNCGNRLKDMLGWINAANHEWWNRKGEVKWK